MLANWVFLLGVALIFTHELDAIRHHEWRIFAFLRPLGDVHAYYVFTLAHIPLFLLFLWQIPYRSATFAVAVDLFLIIHVGLHLMFRNHPLYEFRGWVSNGLIGGAGLVGALHLTLLAFL